eukprot:scaffold361617_cov43-Prasinocladus_malaysianus.AAC.1
MASPGRLPEADRCVHAGSELPASPGVPKPHRLPAPDRPGHPGPGAAAVPADVGSTRLQEHQ